MNNHYNGSPDHQPTNTPAARTTTASSTSTPRCSGTTSQPSWTWPGFVVIEANLDDGFPAPGGVLVQRSRRAGTPHHPDRLGGHPRLEPR